MKDKLEVGMYARYNGRIGKIKYICDCEQCKARGYLEPVIEYIHKEDEYVSCYYKNDLKASHNIIDLIEVGDYVNGFKVYYCYCADEDSTGLFIDTEKGRQWLDKPSQIKTVVTKEQFESMRYVVNE